MCDSPVSANPHYEAARNCFGAANSNAEKEFNDAVRADALIQATLAVAWETGRLADEQRTANRIASLQPVKVGPTRFVHSKEAIAIERLGALSDELFPEGAAQ